MKKILILAVIAISMVACSKNQRKVNKLSGTWKAVSFKAEVEGFNVDLVSGGSFSYQITYDKCKLKDDEFCTFTEELTVLTEKDTNSGLYRVAGDGDLIEMKDDFSSTTIVTTTIEYIAGKEMEVKRVDPDFGEVVVRLEKQ